MVNVDVTFLCCAQERGSDIGAEDSLDEDKCDAEILDELTTSRGELKVRNVNFHGDHLQLQACPKKRTIRHQHNAIVPYNFLLTIQQIQRRPTYEYYFVKKSKSEIFVTIGLQVYPEENNEEDIVSV